MRRALAVLALAALPVAAPAGTGGRESLKPLLEVIDLVAKNYAGDKVLTADDLMKEGLSGMVSGLDRFSEYLDEQKYRDLQEDTRGSFGGIGIEIGVVNRHLQVIAPIEGSPAERAGLQSGDQIAAIEGAPTDEMKIMDAVHRIKGPPGTKVNLTILREGSPARTVAVERAQITPVNTRDVVIQGVGYVTIKAFTESTGEELRKALERFAAQHVTGVILDLRHNPGGLLTQACAVADQFLPGGKLIVSTEGRDPAQRTRYYATDKPTPLRFPLVVLVDENSASASEIVSGALKDWGRAVVMGHRSFGKASVQSVTPLTRDRSEALRLTIAHYFTPRHRDIHEIGIEPDVVLPPVRYPPAMRKLSEATAFNRWAADLVAAPPAWLDPAALKDGRMVEAAAVRGGGTGTDEDSMRRVDVRLLEEFRHWCEAKSIDPGEDGWDEVEDLAPAQLRIAVMRHVKQEEAARRYAVEFDPQVKAAIATLRLASSEAGAAAH